MKKQLFKISILLTIIILLVSQTDFIKGLFKPSTAYAVAGLLIDWGVTPGDPIFVITDMAPGDTQSRTVLVHNGSTDAVPVGIRGMKKSETGNLASVLDITISSNGTNLYGGASPTGPKTLQQFFDEAPLPSFISLSNLNPNQDTSYVVTVAFNESAGNEFQAKNITFDLRIGPAIPVPEACKNINFASEPIYGTNRNDIINGTSGNDMIFAFRGNDIINAKAGNDCIVADQGNDYISAGEGQDVAFGDNGNDIINGGRGNDTLYAGKGNDILDGEGGIDSCSGGKIKTSCESSL